MRLVLSALIASLTCLAAASAAQAQYTIQDTPDSETPPPAQDGAIQMTAPTPATGSLGDQQALAEEQYRPELVRESTDPWEDPQEGYYFFGLFYRHIFIPRFLLELFTDSSTGASNPAFGAEVTYRKGGFDIRGSVWYAAYGVEGPFQAAGDPRTDTEFIESDISVLFLSGAFLWSTPFNDIFAFEYGIDLGVGIVLGDVVRTEAYPSDARGSVNGFAACDGVGVPDVEYCDGPEARDGEDGGHYNVVARKWTNGGSVPNVVPWIAIPHLGLRIKPIHQMLIRLELGVGIGFFMGGSMSYGF